MSIRLIGLLPQVSLVHFVSHLHIMALPALLPILPEFFGVGFIELGLALSVFNIISALVQAPLGFAVDHYGAKRVLLAGLIRPDRQGFFHTYFFGLSRGSRCAGIAIGHSYAGQSANGLCHRGRNRASNRRLAAYTWLWHCQGRTDRGRRALP